RCSYIALSLVVTSFVQASGAHRDLHSFPTRRSSDLAVAAIAALTLTPALLGLAGRRVDRWRVRSAVSEPRGSGRDGGNDSWRRRSEERRGGRKGRSRGRAES